MPSFVLSVCDFSLTFYGIPLSAFSPCDCTSVLPDSLHQFARDLRQTWVLPTAAAQNFNMVPPFYGAGFNATQLGQDLRLDIACHSKLYLVLKGFYPLLSFQFPVESIDSHNKVPLFESPLNIPRILAFA